MPPRFIVDHVLLAAAGNKLANHTSLVWIVGGAGSGKTTLCRVLGTRLGFPVYDMDAHIYGEYHRRFDPARHPVNTAWSSASNGLAWLLDMSWEDFNLFNQAALPEYLDLLANDLDSPGSGDAWLIDGGISNPGLLAQAIPRRQIVCLSAPEQSSAEIWDVAGERGAMKTEIDGLPNGEAAWRKFLEFDHRLTTTILEECRDAGIPVFRRQSSTTVDALASQVIGELGLA